MTQTIPKLCLALFTGVLISSSVYAEDGENAPRPKTIRMGIASSVFAGLNIRDAEAALKVWTTKLAQKRASGHRTESTVFSDRPSALRALKGGDVDLQILTGLDYLEIQESVPLEPALVAIGENGRVDVEYVLLVHRDSGVNALRQLKDRQLVVGTRDDGRTALTWMDVLLLEEQLPENQTFFNDVKKVHKASKAVLPVFFGQADACVVTRSAFETMVELNPQVDRALRVLAHSPGLLPVILCFPDDVDGGLKKILLESALDLHMDSEGEQVLTLFRIQKVEPSRPSHLESLEALVKTHRDLKSKLANAR